MTAVNAPLSLRHRILRAGSWSVFGHVGQQVMRLGSSVIITRLLAPELFGLMALMSSIYAVVALLADVGIRQSLVRSPRGDQPLMLDTAWVMSIGRGFVIWFGCILIALTIWLMQRAQVFAPESVYAASILPLVIIVGTSVSVIHGFASTKMITAERQLEQKKVMMIGVLSLAATITSMIVAALFTKTVWPLVLGTVVGEFVYVALSHWWLKGHNNRFHLDRDCAREIVNFGRWIMASSAFHVFATNGDRLLLGAWASQSQLALYYIALVLAQAVDAVAGMLFGTVVTPALSEVIRRDPAKLREAYWKIRLPCDVAFVLASGFLVATGELVVKVIYDARYHGAGEILQILAFGILFTRYNISGSAYSAMGHSKYVMTTCFARMVSLFMLLPLANHWYGVQGAYWAIALHAALTVPVFFYLDHRHGLLNVKRELQVLLLWPVGFAVGYGVAQVGRMILA